MSQGIHGSRSRSLQLLVLPSIPGVKQRLRIMDAKVRAIKYKAMSD